MQDNFISVDIESDGAIPGDFSMLSIGAVEVANPNRTFYAELKPISDRYDPEALAVSGLDRDLLIEKGEDPVYATVRFDDWVHRAEKTGRPVMVAFNATFDWQFVNWYLIHFLGHNPLGISAIDIKALYMGAAGKTKWSDTSKRKMPASILSGRKHTHNALDDAMEQAEIFNNVMELMRQNLAAEARASLIYKYLHLEPLICQDHVHHVDSEPND